MWNPATSGSENGRYLASIIDDSVITCDEIIKKQQLQQILMKKSNLQNRTFLYFNCIFINY